MTSKLIFWYQKINFWYINKSISDIRKSFFEIRNYFLIFEIIFWHPKLFSDIRNPKLFFDIRKYHDILISEIPIFWYPKIFDIRKSALKSYLAFHTPLSLASKHMRAHTAHPQARGHTPRWYTLHVHWLLNTMYATVLQPNTHLCTTEYGSCIYNLYNGRGTIGPGQSDESGK